MVALFEFSLALLHSAMQARVSVQSKMENLQTSYESKVWTDDFIIPETLNLKSINNNHPSTTMFFMIELRVQGFLKYLPEKGYSIVEEPRGPFIVKSFYLPSNAVIQDDAAEYSICQILSSVGVPLYSMQPIIREVSSFARTMMSLPANLGRPLLPIVLGIEVNSWDPKDTAIAYERKFGRRPEIEEEEPMAKRQRIKDEVDTRSILPLF